MENVEGSDLSNQWPGIAGASECLYLPSPLLTKEGNEKAEIVNE